MRFTPGTAADERRSLNAGQGATEKQRLLVPRAYLLRLAKGREVPAAARAYERNPNVEFAHPNYIAEPVSTTPNDSSFSSLWGLHNTGQTVNGVIGTPDADIDAPEAWDVTQGSTAVTVGVADTGIAYNHPDLAANIWANPGESGAGKETNGVDDDGNGRVDDFRGYDFVSGDNDPMDDNGHGSHVAGTIGAVGNNGTGITGVNWRVRLAPLRICSPDPFVLCTSAAQANAFAYAGQKGMKVVNASISGPASAQIVANAIAGAPGTLFVVAAGNENNNNDTNPQYPCGYSSSNIVCVAASDEDDNRATFSNYGASAVDLAAPGTGILSTYPFPVRFEDDFEVANFSSRWTTGGTRNAWGRLCSGGNCTMTDSPGNYQNNTNSWSRTASSFSLSGMSDCRAQYFLWLNTEQGSDGLIVEASTNASTWTEVAAWSGNSGGWSWQDEDMSGFDGQPNVYLRYRFVSDGSQTGDGAYIDDVAVRCVRAGYFGSEYAFLQGTSMATPHVTGAAALAWARVPGASPAQVKDALLQGVDPKAALAGKVATGGRLNLAGTLRKGECDRRRARAAGGRHSAASVPGACLRRLCLGQPGARAAIGLRLVRTSGAAIHPADGGHAGCERAGHQLGRLPADRGDPRQPGHAGRRGGPGPLREHLGRAPQVRPRGLRRRARGPHRTAAHGPPQRRGAGRERDARRPVIRLRGAVRRDRQHRDRIDLRSVHERRRDHARNRRRGQPCRVAARPGDGRRRRVRRAGLDRSQRRFRRAGRIRALIARC